MDYVHIIVEKKGRVEKISLNRPQVLNALNTPLLLELKAAVQDVARDKETDVVILTGKGRAFSAGLDVNEAISAGYYCYDEANREKDATSIIVDVIEMISRLPQPVIAAINGYAVGGGLEMAMVCDVIIAAENAAFMDTHARVGILPGAGLSQRLPRLIGSLKAREMIFTSQKIGAREAERLGMVNKVVAAVDLDRAAEEMASRILLNNQRILRQIKSMIVGGATLTLGEALQLERAAFLESRHQARPADLNIAIRHT